MYFFADQEAFDSKEAFALGVTLMSEQMQLPHPAVIFEVKDRNPDRKSLIVYARQFEDRIEAAFLYRPNNRRAWTDCLATEIFKEPGWAEVETHTNVTAQEAEGIETALAAHAIFGTPVWVALSADGMAGFKWPEGTRRVTIYTDADDAGRQAAAMLSDRLNIADILNEIVVPLHDDDFNDDREKGRCGPIMVPRRQWLMRYP